MKSLVGLLILSKFSLDLENCIYEDIDFNKIMKLIKKFTGKNYRISIAETCTSKLKHFKINHHINYLERLIKQHHAAIFALQP